MPGSDSDAFDAFDALVAHVRAQRQLDLGAYRRVVVERRLRGRIQQLRLADLAEYLALLTGRPGEDEQLVHHLMIKTSAFFRDRPGLERLCEELVALGRTRGAAAPLRLWSAGCGYGEEPWSLASLAGAAGLDSRLVATDVDARALALAEAGSYRSWTFKELVAADLALLFEPSADDRRTIRAELRRQVRFERHDLLSGSAPAGRFDAVLCRNVLIYLTREAQRRVQGLLLDSVSPGGLLWLGEAERIDCRLSGRVELLDRRARLYKVI